MLRRLFLLALLAAGFGWYWTRWRPAHDYTALSGRLESAINQELAQSGFSDKDVLREVRQTRSRWGAAWVESDRSLQADPRKLKPLLEQLAKTSQTLGCGVLNQQDRENGAVVLELGKAPYVMQHLEFVPKPESLRSPEVALVIDDVAYDLKIMDHFAALQVPLTFAILPRDKHSKELADKATQLNFPVILHLPMEPLDMVHNNPGGAALYLKMNPQQLKAQFEKNVASVPHIQGINNHMGSAFTQDTYKMTLVMQWVKEKNLFFLDSLTSTHSVVSKVAKQVGVPCLINETFLDNADDQAAIEKQLDIVLKLALQRKRTIAIGHYRRKHLVEALTQKIPEFRAHGVTLVGLPALYSSLN